MATKTKVPRELRPVASRTTSQLGVFTDFQAVEGEASETQPLLGNSTRPVNPNSALVFRPIQLPSSSFFSPETQSPELPSTKSQKRGKKEMFHPHDLVSDLYSETSASATGDSALHTPFVKFGGGGLNELGTVPELALSQASLPLDNSSKVSPRDSKDIP